MTEVQLLDATPFTASQYKNFLYEFYKGRTEYKWKQYEWYQLHGNYTVVVAVVDGKLAGQSTGYACKVYCSGSVLSITWGCDTFVLPQYRGLGLGKKLQKYLHDHTTNFSSAGYTPLNGIIKRKCGAKELCVNDFVYYPVSNLLNFAVRKLIKKKFKKEINVCSCGFPLYYYLNWKKAKNFEFQIEKYEEISGEVIPFMEKALQSQYDFYVIRDKDYMQWKYVENPTMDYKLLTVRKGGVLIAVIFFTDVELCTLGGIKLYHCKLLDSIIMKDCGFTQKDALLAVIKYWKSKHVHLDGVASMFSVPYIGRVGFKRPMLSMLQGEKITAPYMAYSDQDLEQMH